MEDRFWERLVERNVTHAPTEDTLEGISFRGVFPTNYGARCNNPSRFDWSAAWFIDGLVDGLNECLVD